MTASPWWIDAVPPQRVDAIASGMVAGAGRRWLFGIWGRWYRCGLDGNWRLCPPPFDPKARQAVMPGPPGAGRPLVPPSILPTGPDLTPGTLASDGLFGPPPPPSSLARPSRPSAPRPASTLRSSRRSAVRTGHAQARRGLPVAVLWYAETVANPDQPILGVFSRYLAGDVNAARWYLQPDLPLIVGAYTERLRAGDPMGAAHIVRALRETARRCWQHRLPAARRALAAMTGVTLQ